MASMTPDDVYHLARHLFGGTDGGGWPAGAEGATGIGERQWRRWARGDPPAPAHVARYLVGRAALERLLAPRAARLASTLPLLSAPTRAAIDAAAASLEEPGRCKEPPNFPT